jgi:hypothetical protein
MSEYTMFHDLSRIFVTLWFRHQVINGGLPYENGNGDLVCNVHGCTSKFKAKAREGRKITRAKESMINHQKSPNAIKYHASLLYVYLPHYLVFKTDIVLSVYAIIKSAKEKKLFRM